MTPGPAPSARVRLHDVRSGRLIGAGMVMLAIGATWLATGGHGSGGWWLMAAGAALGIVQWRIITIDPERQTLRLGWRRAGSTSLIRSLEVAQRGRVWQVTAQLIDHRELAVVGYRSSAHAWFTGKRLARELDVLLDDPGALGMRLERGTMTLSLKQMLRGSRIKTPPQAPPSLWVSAEPDGAVRMSWPCHTEPLRRGVFALIWLNLVVLAIISVTAAINAHLAENTWAGVGTVGAVFVLGIVVLSRTTRSRHQLLVEGERVTVLKRDPITLDPVTGLLLDRDSTGLGIWLRIPGRARRLTIAGRERLVTLTIPEWLAPAVHEQLQWAIMSSTKTGGGQEPVSVLLRAGTNIGVRVSARAPLVVPNAPTPTRARPASGPAGTILEEGRRIDRRASGRVPEVAAAAISGVENAAPSGE